MTRETAPARRYRGASPDERRAQRRCQLIGAAIQVYGERGYRQATVKAVCEAAGLTERYFYESFANSEELLLASFKAVTEAVNQQVRQAALAAGNVPSERARAMLHAYFSALKCDPQSARVFLAEIRGVSRAIDEAFDLALQDMGRELAALVGAPGTPSDELLEIGVMGGVIQIALRWIAQGYRPSVDKVTDAGLRLAMALARAPKATAPASLADASARRVTPA